MKPHDVYHRWMQRTKNIKEAIPESMRLYHELASFGSKAFKRGRRYEKDEVAKCEHKCIYNSGGGWEWCKNCGARRSVLRDNKGAIIIHHKWQLPGRKV